MSRETPTTYRAVMELWKTRAAMARFMPPGSEVLIRNWYHRDAIPEPRFADVIKAAQNCGFTEITYALLSELKDGAAFKKETSSGEPNRRQEARTTETGGGPGIGSDGEAI